MNPGFDRSTGSAFGSAIALTLILLLSAYTYYSVTTRTVVDLPLRADSGDYFLSAYNLVNHGIYSRQRSIPPHGDPSILKTDALRSPGYPLFMAAVGRPEPTDIYLHRVIYTQGAFGVLSVLLLFLIASEFLPAGWSHAAALLAALSPHLPVMSAYLLSETWFTFLLLATLYSFLLAIRKRSAWLFLCAGLLCGLCNLTRSTVQFLPFIAVAATLALPRLRPYLRSSSLFFAGFLLIVSPWTIRNQLLPKSEAEPSLLVNFVLHGSYPGFMYQSIPSSYGYAYRFDPLATEVSRSLPATLRLIHE